MYKPVKNCLTLLIVLTTVLPAFAQQKEVAYTKATTYTDRDGVQELSEIRINSIFNDPVTGEEYQFEKYIDYGRNKFSLDTEYPSGSFEIDEELKGKGLFVIRHTQHDTLHGLFSRIEIGVADEDQLQEPRLIVADEEESIWQYRLTPELVDYYKTWARQHLDSAALLVIPPWPDTRGCEANLFRYERRDRLRAGDTLWTYNICEVTAEGKTQIDTSYIYRVYAQQPLTGMSVEIHATGSRKSNVYSYSEIHFNEPRDSTYQYSYTLVAGDTTHTKRLYTTLRSDTMYYHLQQKGLLSFWGASADTTLAQIVEREIFMVRDNKLRLIRVSATGTTVTGMPVSANCGRRADGSYFCEQSPLLFTRNGITVALKYELARNEIHDLKPLISSDYVQQSKTVHRESAMQKFRHHFRDRQNRRTSRNHWTRTVREKYYERWVKRDNPNAVVEVYYKRK